MSYLNDLRNKSVADLKKLPCVNSETIDAEYVNSRTEITITCDDCDKQINVMPSNLKRRGAVSCKKCKYIKIAKAHQKWKAPAWFQQRYRGVFDRVNNETHKHYKNYGGRGIELKFTNVDEMWKHMKSLPDFSKDLTIDRINNDGNYEAGNLRWASYLTQNNNQRKVCKGVRQVNGSPRYQARITKYGKEVYLGTFQTYEEAERAVNKAHEEKLMEYIL